MTDILMAPRPWTYAPNSGIVEDANGKPVAYLPARFANQQDGADVAAAIISAHDMVDALRHSMAYLMQDAELLDEDSTAHLVHQKVSAALKKAGALAKATAP